MSRKKACTYFVNPSEGSTKGHNHQGMNKKSPVVSGPSTNDKEPLLVSSSSKRDDKKRNNNTNMIDSMVKGVSRFTMCSAAAFDMNTIFGPSLWKDHNNNNIDDGATLATFSTWAETTTSTLPSFSEASPRSITRSICGGTTTSSRGWSDQEIEIAAAAVAASRQSVASTCSPGTRCSSTGSSCGKKSIQRPSQVASLPLLPLSAVAAETSHFEIMSQWTQKLEDYQQTRQHLEESKHELERTPLPPTACDVDDLIDDISDDGEDSESGAGFTTSCTVVDLDDDEEFEHQNQEVSIEDGYIQSSLAQHEEGEGARCDYGNNVNRSSSLDDDPPLSAQTEYARQQLMQSALFKTLQQQQPKPLPIQKQPYHGLQDDDSDDDLDEFVGEFPLLDELEMSRELGGYIEGFEVPTVTTSYLPHLPSRIDEGEEEGNEDDDDDESIPSVRSSSLKKCSATGSSITEPITTTGEGDADYSESACIYCQNGTCDNPDCSGSRFMI